ERHFGRRPARLAVIRPHLDRNRRGEEYKTRSVNPALDKRQTGTVEVFRVPRMKEIRVMALGAAEAAELIERIVARIIGAWPAEVHEENLGSGHVSCSSGSVGCFVCPASP